MNGIAPAIESLPKIHLHCHLEGTLRAETFVELVRRYRLSTRYAPGRELPGPTNVEDVYRFGDFREFLLLFAAVSRALASPEDYARLAREFVIDARVQNVRYGELFVSPSVWSYFHPQLDVPAVIRSIVAELAQADGGEFCLIVDVTRNFGPESAMRTARIAAQLAGEGVIGIGLGGDEARFPAPLFAEVFAFARAQGLHAVAHAGEADGAQSVRDAIEVLGAQRIGHGIRALEDKRVVELLRRRGIALECAPTSNRLTGLVGADAEHPLVQLDEHGVVVTVDADDPALFGTTITRELTLVEAMVGRHDTLRFMRNAIDASFAPAERKAALHRDLEAHMHDVRA